MSETVSRALAVLEGTMLRGSLRAVDMERFWFGPDIAVKDRHGAVRMDPQYSLHVQCSWRIVRSEAIVVGYTDMAEAPAEADPATFDPNEAHVTLRDELVQAFHLERASHPRLVTRVNATPFGDVRIELDDGSILEIFPDAASGGVEHWRLLLPDGVHVVMYGSGLERHQAES